MYPCTSMSAVTPTTQMSTMVTTAIMQRHGSDDDANDGRLQHKRCDNNNNNNNNAAQSCRYTHGSEGRVRLRVRSRLALGYPGVYPCSSLGSKTPQQSTLFPLAILVVPPGCQRVTNSVYLHCMQCQLFHSSLYNLIDEQCF